MSELCARVYEADTPGMQHRCGLTKGHFGKCCGTLESVFTGAPAPPQGERPTAGEHLVSEVNKARSSWNQLGEDIHCLGCTDPHCRGAVAEYAANLAALAPPVERPALPVCPCGHSGQQHTDNGACVVCCGHSCWPTSLSAPVERPRTEVATPNCTGQRTCRARYNDTENWCPKCHAEALAATLTADDLAHGFTKET